MGDRGLPNGGNPVDEIINHDKISFGFLIKTQSRLDVCSILESIVYQDGNVYTQIINKQEFQFSISGIEKNTVTYWPYSKIDRFVISHLRGIANKVAYCFGSKACKVQCPVGVFAITYF